MENVLENCEEKKANLSWILYPDFYYIILWVVLGKYLILETFHYNNARSHKHQTFRWIMGDQLDVTCFFISLFNA